MIGSGRGESNRATGAAGEELAAAYLRTLRYVIVERNFRCRGGEVDIIARDGTTLVFVEVKTRRSSAFGVPQLAVTGFKQRQIARAAQTWLAKQRQLGKAARFDVVAVRLSLRDPPTVEHIPNAFDLPY